MATETYLLMIAITTGLQFLTSIFKMLRKSECMMCGCCTYKTNNDDDLSDYDEGGGHRPSHDHPRPTTEQPQVTVT